MRRLVDRATTGLGWLAGGVACALLGVIVVAVVSRGAPALSLEFLITPMREAGAAGGVSAQILGTGLLVATAGAIAAPVATGLALAAGGLLGAAGSRRLRGALATANGVPTIVLGLLGMLLFLEILGWGKSWLAGGVVLAVMIVPTVAFARLERIDAIPRETHEAAAGLGLSEAERIRAVVLPQSRAGLWSGLLLGLARAAGETAPILFTAVVFSGVGLPDGVTDDPVLALPYHIFVLAQDSYDPRAIENLWGSAAVLLALVLGTSLLALPARLRAHEASRHD